MNIIICPGIHEPELTESFRVGLLDLVSNGAIAPNTANILIFPGKDFLVLSAFHILQFLRVSVAHRRYPLGNELKSPPIIFISFSAGVVGAIGAAHLWQLLGGRVKAFIAIDGWGVPLQGNFPIHRMSHDYFTHWSSCLLGCGQNNFYAEPAVDHLSIWKSPQTVQGCWVDSSLETIPPKSRLTEAEFLLMLLKRYEAN
jgi:pimeloyl-ACP methyl ester carboxylesterase